MSLVSNSRLWEALGGNTWHKLQLRCCVWLRAGYCATQFHFRDIWKTSRLELIVFIEAAFCGSLSILEYLFLVVRLNFNWNVCVVETFYGLNVFVFFLWKIWKVYVRRSLSNHTYKSDVKNIETFHKSTNIKWIELNSNSLTWALYISQTHKVNYNTQRKLIFKIVIIIIN